MAVASPPVRRPAAVGVAAAREPLTYEVWTGDGQDEHLVYAGDSYTKAYEAAGLARACLWAVDVARSICTPLPWTG